VIRQHAIIRQAANHLARAAHETVSALTEGRIEQEPAFTDRMLGRIEEAMADYRSKGVHWSAKTLTDRGPGSQEREFGPDFAGVLDIQLPAFKVRKGFLAQAKIVEPFEVMDRDDVGRMLAQCRRMLDHTSDSFLFVYSRIGIKVVPAISVVSASSSNPHDLYARSLSRFYEEHFECFTR